MLFRSQWGLIPSYWEDSVRLLKGYWTASQYTLRLVSSTGFPVVRINVNIWYYEPCDVCSMSQGYNSNITWIPGGEIMFTCTSDIVIKMGLSNHHTCTWPYLAVPDST